MKQQVLFSLKKYSRLLSAAVITGALRVKGPKPKTAIMAFIPI